MALEDRNLKAGTKLAARYKGEDYTAEVVDGEDGILYRLADGREFKSPSSAGSAIMDGKACNGWRFWSLAKADGKPPAKKPPKKTSRKKVKAFEELPRADDQPEDEARYYCEACADGFSLPAGDAAPKECPKGHKPA